jgi:hypothetical protein
VKLPNNRSLTEDEKRHYAEIRQQVANELPDIKVRAQAAKPRILLRQVLHALKLERERQGLSLADLNKRTGIDPGSLTKLEDDLDPNVSMNTLLRYAQAIGKVLTVQIEDVSAAPNA